MPNQNDLLHARLKMSRFSDRTSDIMSIVRGKETLKHGLNVAVERSTGKTAPNGSEYHVKIKASTETIARDAGVIPIGAWAMGGLRSFNENPVILAFHSHRDPIGKSVYTEIDDNNLVEYWLFHEQDDLSRKMKVLYEEGFMRAASIGFLVHEYSFVDELDDKELAALEQKYGKSATKDIYWIARKAELLETSAVPVPSDPNALAFAVQNAEARGIDMDVFHRFTTPVTRSNKMEPKDVEALLDKQRTAFEASIDAKLTALRTEITGAFKATNDAIEKSAKLVTPAAAAEPAAARGADEDIKIEVKDGETESAALNRYVEEQIAKRQGAPVGTK